MTTSQETRVPIKPGTARRLGLHRPISDLILTLWPDTTRWQLEWLGAELAADRLTEARGYRGSGLISRTPPRRAETQ